MQRAQRADDIRRRLEDRREPRSTSPERSWDFDALSGDKLYLVQYLARGYEIRRYDLARAAARPRSRSRTRRGRSTIWGSAWARLASRDGRYLFTLYIAAERRRDGAPARLAHVGRRGASTCRARETSCSATTWTMSLSPDGRTLWAVSPGFGRVVGIDVGTRKVRTAFRFARDHYGASSGPVSAVSAVSPDGAHIAVGVGGRIFFVSLDAAPSSRARRAQAVALGYSPDRTRLWVVGKQSRVTALPVR